MNLDTNRNTVLKNNFKGAFCAHAFLPIEHVVPAFELITEDGEIPNAFITYFESTYIGVVRGRGHRQRRDPPTFPIDSWNVLSRVAQDLPRSNNSLEAFHCALKSSITSTHPNLWKLTKAIEEELSRSETKDLHKMRGDRALQKNKYLLLTEKFKKQISIYDDSDTEIVVPFLTNLANVIR